MNIKELKDENKKFASFIENLIASAKNPENRKLNDMANYLDAVIDVAKPLLENSKTYQITSAEYNRLKGALVDIEYVVRHEGAYIDPLQHIGNIVKEFVNEHQNG
jgi:hypothetical protein